MEYKIDDVAKLFETTNFAIYSYITRYPELRNSLQAKNGVLTINEVGVDLLHTYIKEEATKPSELRDNQPSAEELYGESHPDVMVKPKDPEETKSEVPTSFRKPADEMVEPPEKETKPTRESTSPYQSFSDFKDRAPSQPIRELGEGESTYSEMKEAILYLRDQLDRKDRQIDDLSRMLENHQMLLKQEQLNFKSLEAFLEKQSKNRP